jgi:hypothetical protein
MRSKLSTILEVAGLTAVSVGAFTVSATVGLIVAGAALFVVGFAVEV